MYARNGKSRTGHTYLQQQLTNTHKLNFLLVCPESEWSRKEKKTKAIAKKFCFTCKQNNCYSTYNPIMKIFKSMTSTGSSF